MDEMTMDHLPHLRTVAEQDVTEVLRKEQTYRGSWRRGGGVNAWHMARRKIDRLSVMLAPIASDEIDLMRSYAAASGEMTGQEHVVLSLEVYRGMQKLLARAADAEDIFRAMDADTSGDDGTVLAEVRDLRRYLLLFEARLLANRARDSAADRSTVERSVSKTYEPEMVRVAETLRVPTYVVAHVISRHRASLEDDVEFTAVGVDIRDPESTGFFAFRHAHDVQAVLDAYAEATARLVPRQHGVGGSAVPAEDSSRHAERGPCVTCDGTRVVRVEMRGGGSSTTVCPTCR